jgi:hypothetical protein
MLFAASVVIWMRIKAKVGQEAHIDGPCHFWERVLLVRADDPDMALQKASEFGSRDAASNSIDLTDEDGNASELIFMGVRKLQEVTSDTLVNEVNTEVAEISASEMVVPNSDELIKLARGETVVVEYID